MGFVRADPGSAARADSTWTRADAATHPHILVVDDDEDACAALEQLLRGGGFATSAALDGETALAQARCAHPDVVLTDLRMPRISGVELCHRLHEADADLPVVVITAVSDMQSVIDSLRAGAEDYLIKPLQYEAVVKCVERAIARRTAKLEQERLRQQGEELYRTLNERLVLSSVREQEHAEAEERQRAQLNALLEHLMDGVAIADRSGRILMMNDAARVILGVGDQDLCTVERLHELEAYDLEGRPLRIEQRPLMRALRGEQFMDYEVLRTRPNGERRHVVSTGTSVRDDNGNVQLAIVVSRDVTELRRLEQQRDQFLALISHDLRNPLNSIQVCVSMLKRSLAEKGNMGEAKLADRAERNVHRMTAMLEELTETTSLESQGMARRRAPCDLRELVASVVDSLDDAQSRRITFEADDASRYVVLGDASQLERVIANLFTNALKYSAEATPVNVLLARKGSVVDLEVTDRGIGIAPESVKKLFDRYYRTTGGKARASGLGLGLYIARMIAEAHGGRIDVSSEVGKGSTFRLMLPSHAASAQG